MFAEPSSNPVDDVLASPPFVSVRGVMNIRTLGGYLISSTPGAHVKPLHLFRSGDLAKITEDGKKQLLSLGVTTIFDLRSHSEIAKFGSATPSIEGVEVVPAPVITEGAWKSYDIGTLLKRYESDELTTFVEEYSKLLNMAGPSFQVIFEHLRDHPSKPCLVHCTVGKDRTGLFSAIVLMLLGVSDADIVKDYSLTAQGLAPFAKLLLARFKAVPIYNENWAGFLKMGTSREETMVACLAMIRERFDGAEGYLKSHAGLSDDDLARVRANLVVTQV